MKHFIGRAFVAFVGLMIIFCTSCHHLPKQHELKNDSSELRAELDNINTNIENLYANKNSVSLMDYYDTAFVYLPEYKPVIYSSLELRKFYTGWFESVDIGAYQKNIYQIEKINDYVLEIGNFSLHYSAKTKLQNLYAGKYMIMWKRNADKKLKIIAEAFGASNYIEAENMPYSSVDVIDQHPLEENIVSEKLQQEIEAFNNGVTKAVIDGDGEARAAEFTDDGIYLPHFDPMQIGMKMIRPYMLKTYKPHAIAFVKNTVREIFDNDDFILLSGHFKVRLSSTNGGSGFEGNMLNLMKRDKDGRLMMYRQLAHN